MVQILKGKTKQVYTLKNVTINNYQNKTNSKERYGERKVNSKLNTK